MQHLVQKQVFNISAPSLLLAQQWESRAGNVLRNVITPCIEQCFDRFATEGEVILLNRMELDLGVLSADISDQQIRKRVEAGIVTALKQLTPVSYTRHPDDLPGSFGDGKQERKEFRNRRLSQREAMQECFINFLLYGRLPWWAEPDKMNKIKWEGDWITQLTTQEYIHIVETLRRWKHARERFAQQFSVSVITKLLERQHTQFSRDASLGWKWMAAAGVCSPALHKVYWTYWISRCIDDNIPGTEMVTALKCWLDDHPFLQQKLIAWKSPEGAGEINDKALSDTGVFCDLLLEALELQRKTRQGDKPAADQSIQIPVGHPSQKEDGRPATKDPDGTAQREAGGDNNAKEVSSPSAAVSSSEIKDLAWKDLPAPDADSGALYADAAGLVILHPFLPELFRMNDLWQGKGWTSEQARHTAVLLVTWLAYGHTDMPEYNMIIPKLLCGMPWEETLDITIPLEVQQKESGAELLGAVVDHWQALGKTSADGLREGFIMRHGKLEVKKDGWLITVEKKAQDVLMSKLPWGISMIRLPWMENTGIYVEWA